MSASASRLSRWQGEAAADLRLDSMQAGSSPSLQGQAQSAMEAAMVASRSAGDRLERLRDRQKARIGQVAAFGLVSLVGLFGLLVFPAFDHDMTLALAGAAGVAVLASGVGLACQAWPSEAIEKTIPAMIAGDLALGAHAKRLGQLAASLEGAPGTTAPVLLTDLIADAERAARASRDREALIRGETDLRGRRDIRIVPRQTRVVVTTAESRSLVARIVDVSRSGIAIEGNLPRCPIGQVVRIGSRNAQVVRVLPRGLACEFTEKLPSAMLTADIVL